MDKFNRTYKFFIDTNDGGQLEIGLPLSIDFNIVRNTLSSANTAVFRIYNLSETNRSRIAKDRWEYNIFKKCVFFGGYQNDFPTCFSGSVQRCYSERSGTDIITTIEAFDAGYAYANAQLEGAQYPKGTARKSIIKDMISKLKDFGVEEGLIGAIEGSIARGNSYSGGIINALTEITGGRFFIDNGKAYVLGEGETVIGSLRSINSQSGLIGTPVRENGNIDLNMVFEPRLTVGQRIAIESVVNKDINQNYKITSVSHQGLISGSVAGTATTKIGCLVNAKEQGV